VLDLRGVEASDAETLALSDRLREELLRTGRYTLVDRSQIDAVLSEQALQQTGCTEQECAVRVGQILGVRKIVAGKVIRVSSETWMVSAIMVDVETAQTTKAESLRHMGGFFTLMDVAIAALAGKLTGVTPRNLTSATDPSEAPSLRSGDTWIESTTGMEFIAVSNGAFDQGCGSWTNECDDDEKPVRRVTLSAYWLGKHEVSRGQFARFVRDTGYVTDAEKFGGCFAWEESKWGKRPGADFRTPGFPQNDMHPATCLSWNDAQAFAAWLTHRSGYDFRLPSEAEWEYACRAQGQEVAYGTQTGQIAVSLARYDSLDGTVPVGHYLPNAAGFYGMAGNVWELTQDVYDNNAYRSGAVGNPQNERASALRVIRGGGWPSEIRHVRCSVRDWMVPVDGFYNLGFRLARNP
jgi:formylglycine-generating enzyme required for sulfatase activity